MTRKGKELDIGGLRIQVDPMVLISRVLMRRKKLLAIIALIGGIVTATSYLLAAKKYTSRANILIRYENFEDQYLQKLLNVGVGYLGADLEMMVIINELDLYPKTRASLPYEMALKEIRRELSVRNQARNIEISFVSKDPAEAQRVTAFVTERLMNKMAELNEAPFLHEAEAINTSIADLEPKKQEADRKLFEFRAKHPEIASRMSEFLPDAMTGGGIESEIRAAERDLIAAKTGQVAAVRVQRNTPGVQLLKQLEAELKDLRTQWQDNAPIVRNKIRQVEEQRRKVLEEQDALDGAVAAGANPEEAKKARIARAEANLQQLLKKKAELEGQAIEKPALQRQWVELSMRASTYASELSQLLTRREENKRNGLLAANRFQENFQLVDAARVPGLPSEPNRTSFMLMGMAITAAIGLLLAAALEAIRQTFVDATELEQQTGLVVFAALPNIRKTEPQQ